MLRPRAAKSFAMQRDNIHHSKRNLNPSRNAMRRSIQRIFLLCLLIGAASFSAFAQESSSSQHQAPPPAPGTSPVPAPPPKASSQPGVPATNTDANYDPYHAEQDMEVGTFYMHKGDLDAAIDRFKDAIRLKPNYAKPRLLLGDLYEKKGEKDQALRYYKEFLQIMPPGSPDAKRVQKKVDKLGKK
jgi:tetratricopeptide (TPR) repeat protein